MMAKAAHRVPGRLSSYNAAMASTPVTAHALAQRRYERRLRNGIGFYQVPITADGIDLLILARLAAPSPISSRRPNCWRHGSFDSVTPGSG